MNKRNKQLVKVIALSFMALLLTAHIVTKKERNANGGLEDMSDIQVLCKVVKEVVQ